MDCDYKFPSGTPSWRTRCRDCYARHRNSLKMRECTVCGLREKREAWKTTCAACYKKGKLAEREAAAPKIEKISKPTLKRETTEDYDFSLLDTFD